MTTDLATLTAKDQIARCIYRLFVGTDQRDWRTVRDCLADDHLHHQAGNLMVDVQGDEATAFCYGIALHHRNVTIAKNVRRFVGSYEFRLRRMHGRWAISSFRFVAKFVDGNLRLEDAVNTFEPD